EIGRVSTMVYDRLGRVIQVNQAGGLTDYYAYDGLGQQIKHWNNFLQTPIYGPPEWIEDYNDYGPGGYWYTPIIGYSADVETTYYDTQGRIISQRAFGGDLTTTSYTWDASIAAISGIVTGGWTQVTTYVNGKTKTMRSDVYGRDVSKVDLGGHAFSYDYDIAGRLTKENFAYGGSIYTKDYSYFNTGQLKSIVVGFGPEPTGATSNATPSWRRETSSFAYDALGNQTAETLTVRGGDQTVQTVYTPSGYGGYDGYGGYGGYGGYNTITTYTPFNATFTNATATYDALGRMTSWTEAGSTEMPAANLILTYDAASNIRSETRGNVTDWYRYDSLNRVVISKGRVVNGLITITLESGTARTYDAASQIITESYRYQKGFGYSYLSGTYGNAGGGGGPTFANSTKYIEVEEIKTHTYNAAGQLTKIELSTDNYFLRQDPEKYSSTATNYSGTPQQISDIVTVSGEYIRDIFGRVTIAYTGGGAARKETTYDAKSQVTQEKNYLNGALTDTTDLIYTKPAGTPDAGLYLLGQVARASIQTVQNGTTFYSQRDYNYAWFDGAVLTRTDFDTDTTNTVQPISFSTYVLGGHGETLSATIQDANPRTVNYIQNGLGQVIRRFEKQSVNGYTISDNRWYRFAGREIHETGNATTGADGLNQNSYTVRGGETLVSIAQGLWGDGSLWYKIAQANPWASNPSAPLTEGQVLQIPASVRSTYYNASTFKPYDPIEVAGNTQPGAPQYITPAPPKKPKCGVFGQILLAVIAVAVTYLTAGAAATALGPVLGGAASAAAGSIASQAFGVATGIQDKFNWKSVGLAAIGGAVGGALQGVNAFGTASGLAKFGSDVARGALSSAITQGIGRATGLQDKFSWAGVAAAGVGAGIAGAVTRGIATGAANRAVQGVDVSQVGEVGAQAYAASLSSFGTTTAATAASAFASAATQSAIEGSSFGRNLVAAIPDVVGQIAGGALGRGIKSLAETIKTNIRADDIIDDLRKDYGILGVDIDDVKFLLKGGIRPNDIVQFYKDDQISDTFGFAQAVEGRSGEGGYRYNQDVEPPQLTELKRKYPRIAQLEQWAWSKSITPYGTDIPLVPSSLDGYLSGTEHGFLVFENEAKNRILWRKLYPDLNPKSKTYGFIKLDKSFFDYSTGRFRPEEKGYNLVLAMHVHPFTVGSVFTGNDGGIIGPSEPDFNTLYANPTAIGWIKSRTSKNITQNFYFGNIIYPKRNRK
ncbi:LysM peptidoglycan-binding domain-containing protein, partial [Sphingorhabdus arenilitoris]